MEALLSLVDVTKRHAGRSVLTGVSLDIAPGEVMGLIGENGVGKSTLVNLIAGSYPIDAGSILFEGRPLQVHSQSEALARGIGIITQDLNANRRLTVAQAIHRTGPLAGLPHSELRSRTVAALREHGFGVSADARLGRLTPLERTMVEMARLAIGGARLILLDEVGASFSRREIEILHEVLARLCARGASALYISHRLAEVQEVCDRVAILRGGAVHRVVDTATTSVEEMTALLLTREQILPSDRRGHRHEEVALAVRGLTLADAEGQAVLDEIGVELHRGEVLGLTGPSRRGGMHELALALTGRAEGELRGSVARDGGPWQPVEAGHGVPGVGYFSALDQARLDLEATIADHLAPAAGVEDPDELAAMRSIIELLASLDVHTGSARQGLGTLSGGDRQKVALSTWMAGAPPVAILDNPSRGLDVRARQDLFEAIVRHTGGGGSVVLISFDPAELLGWCDRIAILRRGRLERVVVPEETDESELDGAMIAPPARALDEPEDEASRDARPGETHPDEGQGPGAAERVRAQRFLVE